MLAATTTSMSATRNGSGQAGFEAHRNSVRLSGAVEILAEDDELVPGETGEGIRGAEQVAQPVGHGHQQVVAHGVPMGVVNRLEAVEIQEKHRRSPTGPTVAQEGVLEAFQHQRPVRQPGQVVVQCIVAGLVSRVLQIGTRLGR